MIPYQTERTRLHYFIHVCLFHCCTLMSELVQIFHWDYNWLKLTDKHEDVTNQTLSQHRHKSLLFCTHCLYSADHCLCCFNQHSTLFLWIQYHFVATVFLQLNGIMLYSITCTQNVLLYLVFLYRVAQKLLHRYII